MKDTMFVLRPSAFVLAVLILLPSTFILAFASSGGRYSLESQAVGPGGGASAGALEARTFLEPAGSYLRFFATVQVTAFAAASGGVERRGMQLAVPSSAPVAISFSVAISTQSLVAATTVTLLQDHLGRRVDRTVPFAFSYNPATGRAAFVPPGGWENGGTYRVAIGTGTVDQTGSPIALTLTAQFQSELDFAQENVLRPLDDESVNVRIPAGALPGNGYVVLETDPLRSPDAADPAAIREANARAFSDLGPQAAPVALLELNAYASGGARVLADGFAQRPVLTLAYPDADRDGLVDGQALPGHVPQLSLWTLDEDSRLWIRVPGSSIDTAARTVSAPLPHFSVYAVMATVDTNVSSAYAYPVPWRPFASDSARYGTLAGGITFVNLPQVGDIRIYTLSGLLVREQALDGSLKWVWDGRNKSGQTVVSGSYLWIVQSAGNKKAGKLMIIR